MARVSACDNGVVGWIGEGWMWVTADDGRLVNMDHVRQVVVDGKRVVAVLEEQSHVGLIEPTKAAPQHYVDQIAVALSNGTLHVDLRHVGSG